MSQADFIAFMTLALLNVIQLVVWSVVTQRLVNKLMSKNYAEYDLIKNGPPIDDKPSVRDYHEELEEREILEELNGLFTPHKDV